MAEIHPLNGGPGREANREKKRMGTDENGELLLPSGGYARLKSFRLARLIYDITVHFAELYIPADSRTRDQMIQAARSGVQNIAEGSVDAATSAKLELNLYNVARGSLEELRLDYQDYLRRNNEPVWAKDAPLYSEFVARRVADKAGFRAFIRRAEMSYPSVQIRTGRQRRAADRHGGLLSQTSDRKQGPEFSRQRRLLRTHGPDAPEKTGPGILRIRPKWNRIPF